MPGVTESSDYIGDHIDQTVTTIAAMVEMEEPPAEALKEQLKKLLWLVDDLKISRSMQLSNGDLERGDSDRLKTVFRTAAAVAQKAAIGQWHDVSDLAIELISQVTSS